MSPALPIALLALLALVPAARAAEGAPKPPAGKDAGGPAVALIAEGVDYMDGAVAAVLARDGEGEMIGWDAVANDPRPHATGAGAASGSALARQLGGAGIRVVAVRADAKAPLSIARGIAFAARTPAEVIVVASPLGDGADWEPVRKAAAHFKDRLVVVAAGTSASATAPNVVVVGAKGSAHADVVAETVASGAEAAVAAVTGHYRCRGKGLSGATGAEKRSAFLAAIAKAGPNSAQVPRPLVAPPCP